VDTSYVKNVHGRDVTGRGRKSKIFYPTNRGRKATKISLLTDSRGTPLCCVFHRGNKSHALILRHLLDTASRKTERLNNYSALMGDKGYDSSTTGKDSWSSSVHHWRVLHQPKMFSMQAFLEQIYRWPR
jgi:hypothetical protein